MARLGEVRDFVVLQARAGERRDGELIHLPAHILIFLHAALGKEGSILDLEAVQGYMLRRQRQDVVESGTKTVQRLAGQTVHQVHAQSGDAGRSRGAQHAREIRGLMTAPDGF